MRSYGLGAGERIAVDTALHIPKLIDGGQLRLEETDMKVTSCSPKGCAVEVRDGAKEYGVMRPEGREFYIFGPNDETGDWIEPNTPLGKRIIRAVEAHIAKT